MVVLSTCFLELTKRLFCFASAGVSGNSRSRTFPRMEASDSLPEFREWIFFIPFPFPNSGNGFFSFPSRSRILGMDFFIPFPFPNLGNGFFPFPSRSRIDPFKVGNQKGKWEILRDACIPTFSASCTFIQDKNGGSKVKVAYVKVSNQATS